MTFMSISLENREYNARAKDLLGFEGWLGFDWLLVHSAVDSFIF